MVRKRRDQYALHQPGDTVDLYAYNDATAIGVGVYFDTPLRRGDPRLRLTPAEAAAAGLTFALELPSDASYNVRFRLGEPDPQEAAEWTGRAEGWLDLSVGQIGSGEAPTIQVPPGRYRVEVCCYLPHSCALECLEQAMRGPQNARRKAISRPEPLREYWERTRPGLPVPSWLIGLDLQDKPEPDDPQYNSEDQIENLVEFVIRLSVLTGDPPVVPVGPRSVAPFKTWECRVPAACPMGIVADLRNPYVE